MPQNSPTRGTQDCPSGTPTHGSCGLFPGASEHPGALRQELFVGEAVLRHGDASTVHRESTLKTGDGPGEVPPNV